MPGATWCRRRAVSWVGVLPTHRRRGVLTRPDDAPAQRHPRAGPRARRDPLGLGAGRSTAGSATAWRASAYSLKVPRDPHALRPTSPTDPALRLRLVPTRRTGRRRPTSTRHVAARRPGCSRATSDGGGAPSATSPSCGTGARHCAASSPRTTAGSAATRATAPSRDWSTPARPARSHVREVIGGRRPRPGRDLPLPVRPRPDGPADVWNSRSTTRCCTGCRTRAAPSRSSGTRCTCGSSTSTRRSRADLRGRRGRGARGHGPALPVERRDLAAGRRRRRQAPSCERTDGRADLALGRDRPRSSLPRRHLALRARRGRAGAGQDRPGAAAPRRRRPSPTSPHRGARRSSSAPTATVAGSVGERPAARRCSS